MSKHVLEPKAREFADDAAQPPFLDELGRGRARKVLDDIQAAPTSKLHVHEKWVTVQAEAAAAATIGIAAATGLVLFFMGVIGVHLRAHEHHHIITTVGYFLLATASLVASTAP